MKKNVNAAKNNYTPLQKTIYTLKRYAVFAAILVPCYLYLAIANQEENVLLSLLVTRTARSTLGVFLGMLFMKFAFPKIDLQTELVEEHNIASAIIFAAVIIGVCL